FQITLSRQQPSNSGVSVEIRDHSFDKVVRWLDSLAESHGIKVYSATISRKDSGIVDARLLLQ
ncbi:MAG: type II secretion system protein GspM, partial [Gammaproteobacteria bacterium]|nr:type II secretion system protein GspM [Gammaproteobacteria bacterium]